MGIFDNLLGKGSSAAKVDLKKRFQLFGQVGQGSMSEVYKATDRTTGQLVALKILDKEKTEAHAKRFLTMNKPLEGEVACSLIHPHIVKTLDHGISTDDHEFLVMEYVEGYNLSYLVDTQNKVMQENRVQFIIDLGRALEHFHAEGWIHRDLCPRNIMVDTNNQIKMIDFGLVVPNRPEFCKPGNRTGTAAYMAPELFLRKKTDQRLDIFSYAVTCYEMFTQELPWPSTQTMETAKQRINTPPEDIRNHVPDIDESVAFMIMKGLKKEQSDRWQTMTELLQSLPADVASKPKKVIKKTKDKKTEQPVKKEPLPKKTLTSDTGMFELFISEVTEEAKKDERKKTRKKRTAKSKKKKSKRKTTKKKKSKRKRPPTDD